MTEKLFSILKTVVPGLEVRRDEPMSAHTSFKTGGPADIFVEPKNEDELVSSLKVLHQEGLQPLLVGRGSNLLVSDAGIRGTVIHLGDMFSEIKPGEGGIYAQAGASLASVASAAMQAGLGGMEFAHGIPGSVGGAVMMNAGAYGGEMADIVRAVRCINPEDEIVEITDCDFSYRHSRFEEADWTIIGAYFELSPGEKTEILAKMKELMEKRTASQPLDKPSAGSTFKRPANGYAAAMIDQTGLKGFSIGGAAVSEKHAGFVVNLGQATSADILAVMAHVRETVYERFGVELEPEVRIVG